MKHGLRLLVTLGALLSATLAAAQGLPVMELQAGFHRIEAEVAHTPQARIQGLMQRRAMPQQRGMLFVFPETEQHCMWMKNTYLPLSVAFLDGDGRIINVADMQPHSEENHCAAKPARYALEMNQGWFARRGLKPGDAIGGIERAPQAR
ncbi:MAG: DUF192 domain-containing protein [Rhodocyclaceae bacterium]|nr:DUF192 domain-containing protein [Rhodocyclaceae bacterium]